MAIDLCLVDLDDLGHVSASSTQMNVHLLESNALQILLRRKVEEEANLETENVMVDFGFQEMAALKHNLKVALRIYDALQHSRCFACRGLVTSESRSSIGLRYFTYALCLQCFHALTTLLTNDETLVQNHCIALTEDGVHAAATLLQAYRMGSEDRMSQGDAPWVAMSLPSMKITCRVCFGTPDQYSQNDDGNGVSDSFAHLCWSRSGPTHRK